MKSDCSVKSYKYMAKCLALVLILGLSLFLFSGCGDKGTSDKDSGNQTTVEDQEQTTGDDATDEKTTSQDSQDSTTTSDSKTSTSSKDSATTTKSDSKSDTGSTSSDTNKDSSSSTSAAKTCTIQINCSLLVGKEDLAEKGLETLVPSNGIILKTTTVTLQSGDTVYDVTRRITKSKKIQLSTQGTAAARNLYVDGISNIYEKAYNSKSGWVYLVNGKKPSSSCGSLEAKAKDKIVWAYTLDLGNDL